jgi:hypothetical protein
MPAGIVKLRRIGNFDKKKKMNVDQGANTPDELFFVSGS